MFVRLVSYYWHAALYMGRAEPRREHRFEHGFRAPQSRIRGHESIFVDAQFYESELGRVSLFLFSVTFFVCLNGFNNFLVFDFWLQSSLKATKPYPTHPLAQSLSSHLVL